LWVNTKATPNEKDVPQTTKAVLDNFEKIGGVSDYVILNTDGKGVELT
jgi:hypothetical protein